MAPPDRADRDARLAVLERQLRALGPQIAVPEGVGTSIAVRRRLESGAVPTGRVTLPPSPTRRRVLVGVAIALIFVVGLTLAISSSRNAVADWLGLRGVEIEHTNERPSGLGADLRLGRPVSLGEAQRALGFE